MIPMRSTSASSTRKRKIGKPSGSPSLLNERNEQSIFDVDADEDANDVLGDDESATVHSEHDNLEEEYNDFDELFVNSQEHIYDEISNYGIAHCFWFDIQVCDRIIVPFRFYCILMWFVL